MIQLVKNCLSCAFYNDGHGNGGYCSGMDVSEASCNHPNNTKHNVPVKPEQIPSWCPLWKGDYIKTLTTHIQLVKDDTNKRLKR